MATVGRDSSELQAKQASCGPSLVPSVIVNSLPHPTKARADKSQVPLPSKHLETHRTRKREVCSSLSPRFRRPFGCACRGRNVHHQQRARPESLRAGAEQAIAQSLFQNGLLNKKRTQTAERSLRVAEVVAVGYTSLAGWSCAWLSALRSR